MSRDHDNVLGFQRPALEPPEALPEPLRTLWEQIAARMPSDWFDPANGPLLESYLRHYGTAQVLDEAIGEFKPEWLKDDEGLQRYHQLLGMRERQTGSLLSLARALRLTNQSRYRADKAAVMVKNTPKGRRPWEH